MIEEDHVFIRDLISEHLGYTAEWRVDKAREYPHDKRNEDAATLAARLAQEVGKLDPSAFDGLVRPYADDDTGIVATEIESEMTRSIGFHEFPTNGAEFVAELTKRVSDAIRSAA